MVRLTFTMAAATTHTAVASMASFPIAALVGAGAVALAGAGTEAGGGDMSEAWDKVQAAAQALKDALNKAAHTSPADAATGAADATKHVLDRAGESIDTALDWAKDKIKGGKP